MSRHSFKVHVRGFSLIEVLISILILSFGVLAMGGLQLATLKSNQIAGNSSMAATLAKDYTEMMRSNWTVSNNTSTVAGVNPYLFDSNDITKTSTYCTTMGTTSTMAALHVADWAQRVSCQLPSARAVVCRDPAPRNADGSYRWSCGANDSATVSIKIGWIDKRESIERGTTTVSATPLNPQLVMSGMTGYAE
ncbi:type IV pilus modification protein PilV [Rhodoferax ferrireducens]|uniref:type IV pilus modification protein PilV n=1 Tax=Rhodoferax ferrireducens TaxID=192843 RepID=UPI000E0DF3DB|nr:type IV pilus modification protein PilV [Rhodoferax ferrireducens]